MRIAPPAVERVPLAQAHARVLAQGVVADADYPNAPRSAMDGYALAASETPGTFTIVRDVRMGEIPDPLRGAGYAAPIPTGGVLPEGADTVVPIEEAVVEGTALHVASAYESGTNAFERAADMRAGERLLEPGARIGAPQAGLLASLGITNVDVYRKPVVAVFSSGDELVDAAQQPLAGQVRDSNRYAIAALLQAMGAQPRHYPRLSDERAAFVAALAHALDECDAVAVSGGSSVGARDALPAAVESLRDPGIVVHGVRVKPGKPLLLGAHRGKPILGLPGNPTSALVVLQAIAAPIVAALVGALPPSHTANARLGAPLRSRAGWTWYLPVALRHDGGTPVAHPLPLRSFSVSLTARADGYVVMNESDEEWPTGTIVTVHLFQT